MPNFNFISDWGDSLKRNVDATWREKFMKSTYAAANDDVYAEFKTDFDTTKERAFFEWMQRQKTYFGELMQPAERAEFERQFEAADVDRRREMLEGLRQLTSVIRPDTIKSHSQTMHCPMAKTEDPELTAMTSEMTKIKTLGTAPPIIRTEDLPPPGQKMPPEAFRGVGATFGGARAGAAGGKSLPPRPASATSRVDLSFSGAAAPAQQSSFPQSQRPSSVAGQHHRARPGTPSGLGAGGWGGSGPSGNGPPESMRPLSAMAQRQAQQLNGGRPSSARPAARPKPAKQKTVDIETFKSKVPLKWAGVIVPGGSSYSDAYGSLITRRPASASLQSGPIKYKEVTCPIGAVDRCA